MDDTKTEAPPAPSQQELQRLVAEANTGDEQARARLHEYLDQWPEISRRLGDLAQHVQLSLIGKIAGGNSLLYESITRGLNGLRAELVGDGCSPLEKLAIERVLAAWLHLQSVDISYPSCDELPTTTARFVLQLRESSQRRFDAATKSLATLRKLLSETPAAKRATLLRLHAGA